MRSLNASNAAVLTTPLQVTNLTGTIPNSLLSTNVALLTNNVIFSAGVTATNFTGNGYGLSNVPATSLIGTIPDVRLSTNVALQSNPNLNFAGAVSATNFTGAGHGLTNVPGAFFWVTVSNTSAQIFPNVGYIVTNNTTPVTLTLPLSPSAGDVYKVAGVGAGGWIIAQNTNQMIAAGNLAGSIGQNWQISGPGTANWSSVAASADGTKIAATINGGYIYVSTNSGVAWLPRNSSPGSLNYSDVAVSADGTKMRRQLETSIPQATTVISGTQRILVRHGPAAAAAASNGFPLLLGKWHQSRGGGYNGYLYVSSNAGQGWSAVGTSVPGSLSWTSVASSANGSTRGGASGGQINTSTNSGSTWQQRTDNASRPWNSVAVSSDGAAGGSAGQRLDTHFD